MAQDKKAEVLATIALVSGLTSTWLKKTLGVISFVKRCLGVEKCVLLTVRYFQQALRDLEELLGPLGMMPSVFS